MKLKVPAKLTEASPDITDFKKYAPVLTFENLYVLLTVEGVKDGDRVVVTEDAAAEALTGFAMKLYRSHMAAINTLSGAKR